MFLNDWLTKRSHYTPDVVAIVDDVTGVEYGYGELNRRANRLAGFLQHQLGLGPGDRVACLSTNRLEYIDLYFACGKIGVVLVPLNFRLPTDGLAELVQDCQPRLFVGESQFAATADELRRRDLVPNLVSIDGEESVGGLPTVSCLVEEPDLIPDQPAIHQADEHDAAMILYTSGTTGRAKGAVITWRQIHWNVFNTAISLPLTRDDVAFLNMPLYHTGGWHVLFTPLMLLGGRVILQPKFDARRCNEMTGPAGVTIAFGVPTMLGMMCQADNFDEADYSAVRFAICGGEPCPVPTIEAFGARGVAIRQGYGLTEAGPNCYSLPAADALRKSGSIGFPNFHIDVRLQKDDGSEAKTGEVGELLMRGPHLFRGYWRNPKETERTLVEGWIRTGDLMTCDDEGYYYVVGRKKDMYISGGENVYPAQAERVLQSHPAVSQASVVGVPDPKWGETGWAFITLNAANAARESELIAWCKRCLATFQSPTKVMMMDELPLGQSGKIDKLALRQIASEMLADNDA